MNQANVSLIAKESGCSLSQVSQVIKLIDEGATIPFIARYRKEATGSLDEVAITFIRDRKRQLDELDKRREAILKSLEENGHLTRELKEKVIDAKTMATLEDIYLPFRPKRKTKGFIAREKGLEPLAMALIDQKGIDPVKLAADFVNPEKSVESIEEALTGARHIIAEIINEDARARSQLRKLFEKRGKFISKVAKGMEGKGVKYKDYFDWEEPLSRAPSHRVLAMRRGEKEEILNLEIAPPQDEAIGILKRLFIKGDKDDSKEVEIAVIDSYKRLLSRALETEFRISAKEKADKKAIKIFSENLKELLLGPPLGAKRVMGIDPGFRTGCKIAILDRQGKLIDHSVIYLHQPEKSKYHIMDLCNKYKIEAISVGNGTGGRETEKFLLGMGLPAHIKIVMVNESGASVYSASLAAREEFPDLDLTVRGAVSIGRRLMDPLSELVKIDPKSIGVGQYQHDVDQKLLKEALDDVVVSCVNMVGVDVNRASIQLLTYVSGLGPALAKNIVSFRDENGPFKAREDLKKVKRLGPKAFEQSAGFLRITDSGNPLDSSAVHPESYYVVENMAKDLGCTIKELINNPALRKQIDINKYVTDKTGLPTLQDIMKELEKPGRDPRDKFEFFSFAPNVEKMEDLKPGMKLPGIITNVTAFGAFVDIGVHQDGLVHISQLADRFVKDPADMVKIHQKVMVRVLDVDIERKRISLSMKQNDPGSGKKRKSKKNKNTPFNNVFAEAFGGKS